MAPPEDEPTRHVCAAVHVDEALRDEIITEFLTEPRRAIPPSPGLDPVVVLSEALAARRRAVFRDSVAILLFAAAAVAAWPYSLLWLLAAVLGQFAKALLKRDKQRRDKKPPAAPNLAQWVVPNLAAVVLAIAVVVIPLIEYVGDGSFSDFLLFPGTGYPGILIGALLLAIAVAGVLFVDRLHVHRLLRHRFHRIAWNEQRGWHDGYPVAPPKEYAWYAPRLQLVGAFADDANTHVHYGYNAFVGAGTATKAWTVVTRLRPISADTTPELLSPSTLYQAVIDEVLALREANALVPGQRLTTLAHKHEVIASANALLDNPEHPLSAVILPNRSLPPENRIAPELIERMIDRPPEWARPYLTFTLEGWREQLVVSTFLHIGCHDDMLCIEFEGYQLNPIKQEYEVERMPLNYPHQVALHTLLETATLPFTLPRRVRSLWRAFRDASGLGARTDLFDPAKSYGARRSIREIAAGDDTTTFFEDIDGIRYLRLLEHRTLTALVNAIQAHGWNTDEIVEQRTTIINASTVISGGSVVAGAIGGLGNQVRAGQVGGARERSSGGDT